MTIPRTSRLVLLVGASILLAGCISFAAPDDVSVPGPAVLVDVTGDGSADILSSSAAGLARYEYCGVACVSPKEEIAGEHLRQVGDFNNDAKQDVIAFDGSNFTLLFGSDTGLSTTDAVAIPRPFGGYTISAIGDFNGDGKADLLWGSLVFNMFAHSVAQLGNGAGGFTTSSFGTLLPTGEAGHTQLEVGDVNGDGRDDLIASAVGQVQVVEYGGPQCDFGGLSVTCPAFQQSLTSDLLAVGDVNGDGRVDLARYEFSSHSVDFFRSTGSSFTPFPLYQTIATATSGSGVQMGLRDVDGDGVVDFELNDGATARTWWSGTDDGGFPYRTLTDVPLRASGCTLCFGDVNGDGRLDAIVPNSASGNELWINTSNPSGT